MAKSIFSFFSFRFVSITITSLAGRFYYRLLLFLGTTHLGNKNKGREADTIEKQKPAAKKKKQKNRAEKKECLMIFLSLNKIF